MKALSARDFVRGWFWGMIAVGAIGSIGVRLAWERAFGSPGAHASGDFVMFAVILGFMSARTATAELSVRRRVTGIILGAAVATGLLALFLGVVL